MFDSIGYFLRAFRLSREPGLRRWVFLPLAFNIVLFIGLYWLLGGWLSGWVDSIGSGWQPEGSFAFLGSLVEALRWLLQVLAWLVLLMAMASTFTIAVQLIAAPFMGFLAEQADRRISALPLPQESLVNLTKRTLRRELVKTWDWLWRTLLVALLVLILWLIPVINVLAPLVWFLWSGWLLGLQYLDYGADTRQVSFENMKARARQHRWLVGSFGCLTLTLTMVPMINLLVMPVAVIAGTLIWLERVSESR